MKLSGKFASTALAGLSAISAAVFVETGEPVFIGLAVFIGLLSLIIATDLSHDATRQAIRGERGHRGN